ncbi:MAG: VCBS repeat-containing protein, partial [Tannerella sp.]|nr:VCBS repeat-containing protein [Tannerella sp.]
MLRIYSLISGVIFVFFSSYIHSQTYGSLEAVNDTVTTGPMQSVRINVIANDTMPCIDSYSWHILTTLNNEGTVETKGDYMIFDPSRSCRDTTVRIQYAIKCNNTTSIATVVIKVTYYNQPINVLPNDLKCFEDFQGGGFAVENKFHSNAVPSPHSHKIIVYSLPLVGDLNGDKKPEILAVGLASTFYQVTASAGYIIIMDGQTGKTLVEKDMGFDFVVSSDNPDASGYHSSPSYMAIADVDNDGKGEIIMAFPIGRNSANAAHKYSEQVVAFKVETNSAADTIIDIKEYWKATVGYKAPLTGTDHLVYDVPAPYIADLNGDGIPEVIVYNKIYNAQTGRLLMAWDGPATAPKNSSSFTHIDTCGLKANQYADIYTSKTFSDTV